MQPAVNQGGQVRVAAIQTQLYNYCPYSHDDGKAHPPLQELVSLSK